MPEGLPYFKFFPRTYTNGRITLLDEHTQGVFINVCSYYWMKNGLVSEEEIRLRFRKKNKYLERLFKQRLIKKINSKISISFLDEQLETFENIRKKNSENGKLGGRKQEATALGSVSETEATVNPSVSERQGIGDKEEDKDKDEEGEEKEKEKGGGADALLPGPLGVKLNEWEQHLREKKCRLTPSTKKLQIEKLRAMSPSLAVATINFSITNGYTGLFEERQKQQNGKRTHSKQQQAREGRDYLAEHYGDKLGGKKI